MKTISIAKYELKKIFRNQWLIVILFIGSILVVSLFGFVANHAPKNIPLGIFQTEKNSLSDQITQRITYSSALKTQRITGYENGQSEIRSGRLKGFVIVDIKKRGRSYQGEIKIVDDPRYPEIQAKIRQEIVEKTEDDLRENISNQLNSALIIQGVSINRDLLDLEPIRIETEEKIAQKINYFDRFASGIIVLVVLLICMQLSAVSITHERETGTFERLAATPSTKSELIFGKIIANSIIGIMATILVTFVFWLFLDIALGNLGLVFLIEVLVALIAVTLGILISSITYNVVASVQIAFYSFFAFVITSELFWTQENVHHRLAGITKLSPFTYAIEALKKINLHRWGWTEIQNDIFYLIGFLALFLVLSTILLRREAR